MSCYHQLHTLGKYMKSSASFKVSLMLSQLILINVFFLKISSYSGIKGSTSDKMASSGGRYKLCAMVCSVLAAFTLYLLLNFTVCCCVELIFEVQCYPAAPSFFLATLVFPVLQISK